METHIRNNRKRVHLKLKNTKHGAEKGVKILQTSSQKSMRKNGANKGGCSQKKNVAWRNLRKPQAGHKTSSGRKHSEWKQTEKANVKDAKPENKPKEASGGHIQPERASFIVSCKRFVISTATNIQSLVGKTSDQQVHGDRVSDCAQISCD